MYDGGQCDNEVFKEFVIKQYSKRVKSNGIQCFFYCVWAIQEVSGITKMFQITFMTKWCVTLGVRGEQKQINRYQDQLANAYTTYVKKRLFIYSS